MKKWMLLVGPLLIVFGVLLLYFLIEGIAFGALVNKGSIIESQSDPVVFWILASVYALGSVGMLGIGVLLTKEGLQRRWRDGK